jgi:2-polyprenyl-3-methyl-5-hydroxy-6-metoxy-1,4-benzoquinol methylase
VNKTGERHFADSEITTEVEYYNHLMHIATYQFALKYVKEKSVLDYGCGSGYGSHILASNACKVTAVDVSDEAIEYARNLYFANNLTYKTVSELTDEKFDIITSFQVIEHVPDAKDFIQKIKKLLKQDGYLLISTPDKTNRLFKFIQQPWNVFHVKEYSSTSLKNLLNKYFTRVDLLKIGSRSDLVIKEILRTKKQRLITLPCTLFFYPDYLRVFLLNLQVRLFKMISYFRRNKEHDIPNDFKLKYSIQDIEINNNLTLSTDLLAICNK